MVEIPCWPSVNSENGVSCGGFARGESRRRTNHWMSGSEIQEIITQTIRTANEKPTAKCILSEYAGIGKLCSTTSIFGSKYYGTCCARDIVERGGITVIEDVRHDFNWEDTDGDV